MKQQVTLGIVLSRTNYGEADRIITVLTRDYGKIRLLAKGVRKIKSRLAGGIELFSTNDITYIVGRGDLCTLVSSRLVKNFDNIVKDIDRTIFMYDALKAINRITEDSPEPEYFALLATILEDVNDAQNVLATIGIWMNMQLLKLSGHTPNLTTNSSGSKLASDDLYVFGFEDMTFSVHAGGPFNAQHIKLLRLASSVDSATKLSKVQGIDKLLSPLLQLTRTMLKQHTRAL